MLRQILIDTGPLKGLLDANDQEHERAKNLFRRAEEAELTPVCPYPVLLELHRLLMYRKPARSDAAIRAHTALEAVCQAYETSCPDEKDLGAALALLQRFSDQTITLTDATIASMAARAAASVMTFDLHHFSVMGTDVLV
jgi:predicted nucleic acid-binding protein